jgi:hypothetical protein
MLTNTRMTAKADNHSARRTKWDRRKLISRRAVGASSGLPNIENVALRSRSEHGRRPLAPPAPFTPRDQQTSSDPKGPGKIDPNGVRRAPLRVGPKLRQNRCSPPDRNTRQTPDCWSCSEGTQNHHAMRASTPQTKPSLDLASSVGSGPQQALGPLLKSIYRDLPDGIADMRLIRIAD